MAGGIPGGNTGELQYNNNGNFGGAANTSFLNGNLTLGNISNVKIAGGTNGYFLQTDGSGNLTWAQGTANVSGNGTAAGANNSVQLSDGTGNFKAYSGLIFDTGTQVLDVPGNVSANYFIGDGSQLTGLDLPVGNWSNVANIPVNGLVFAKSKSYSPQDVAPGANFTVSSNPNISFAFGNVTPNVSGNLAEFNTIGNVLWTATASGNSVAKTTDGKTWTSYSAPFDPVKAPVKGNVNYVIFATSTANAAYSTNQGVTWSNVALPNSGQWNDIAYGQNTFVMSTSQFFYNKVARSTNDGLTWTDANVTASTTNENYRTVKYGNGKFILAGGGTSYISTDAGATWTAGGPGFSTALAYGNGLWVNIKGSQFGGAATVNYSTNDGVTWTNGTIANAQWNGMTFVDPYFITSELANTQIAYSTDGNSWSYANTAGPAGGAVGYNPTEKQLFVSAIPQSNISSVSQPDVLEAFNNLGNASQTVTAGVYRNLGGSSDNSGALWIRLS